MRSAWLRLPLVVLLLPAVGFDGSVCVCFLESTLDWTPWILIGRRQKSGRSNRNTEGSSWPLNTSQEKMIKRSDSSNQTQARSSFLRLLPLPSGFFRTRRIRPDALRDGFQPPAANPQPENSHRALRGASEMLQRCFRDASEMLQRCFRDASEMLQGWSMDVSRMPR